MKKCICLYDVECINCPLSNDCNAVKIYRIVGQIARTTTRKYR